MSATTLRKGKATPSLSIYRSGVTNPIQTTPLPSGRRESENSLAKVSESFDECDRFGKLCDKDFVILL